MERTSAASVSEEAIRGVPGLRLGEHVNRPALFVETPAARAVIGLSGAQLLSYAPAGHDDLLWVSPLSTDNARPVRGGVPLCWPWFARQGVDAQAQQHGIARTAPWRVVSAQVGVGGAVTVTLTPLDPALHTLRVALRLDIGATLTQALTTTNPAAEPFALTQALHTYFRVSDAPRVSIAGVEGLEYLDKPTGFSRRRQDRPWRLDGECDRIYLAAGGDYALDDPGWGRRIRIRSSNSRTLVVWNPGPETVAAFTDIAADGWREFLCMEVANAGEEVVTLGPGGAYVLTQTLSVEPLAR